MKRHVLKASLVAAATAMAIGTPAFAAGPALNSANHAQWNENAYYNGFGGPLPAGIVEGSAGFSTIGDYSGRVISNAVPDITTNKADPTVLTTINSGLFAGTDVNLYEIQITNSSSFSASVPSSSLILALFDTNGNAISASIGGPADALTVPSATPAGLYWLGIANPSQYPQNAEGQNLFGLDGSAGVFTPAVGITDLALAGDPHMAWALPLPSSPLVSNTSFVAAGSTITLAGTNFAVVPEPTSIALLGTVSLFLIGRQRKSQVG